MTMKTFLLFVAAATLLSGCVVVPAGGYYGVGYYGCYGHGHCHHHDDDD